MNWKYRLLPLSGLLVILALMTVPALAAPAPGSMIEVNFMSQDPDPANAGQYVDLRWQAINYKKDPIDNLRFHLEVEYPLLFEAGDTQDKEYGASARTGDDKDFYTVRYRLRVADNAVKGWYNATLSWNDGGGWIEADFPVYVDSKQADFVIGALVTSPERLITDTDEAKLSVAVDNIGESDAQNVKVKLVLPEGFTSTYSYSDEDGLGIIESGQSKTANFYIDIDENVKDGEYPAHLEISYRDENDQTATYRSRILDLIIPVKPTPYLVIESVNTTPEVLLSGQKATVLVRVRNTGNEEIEAVSLRMFKDSTQPFIFEEKSDFVGKLGPGESGEAIIRMNIDSGTPAKKHLLDVELRGIDQNDNVLIFRRIIPLEVQEGPKDAALSNFGFAAVLMVAGIIGGAFYFRNGRNPD